jgi:serine/threonine protein kinase
VKANEMPVAIKIFAPDSKLDEKGLEVFKSEYALVFNLSHPNILTPYHFDDWHGKPYLLMPFMKNGSCAGHVGKFEEAAIARFLSNIGGALSYLHGEEPPIIHRDIKPDNILIDDKGRYRLSDFGISSKLRNTLTKTVGEKSHSFLTYAYAAPELFGKKPEPTVASDIWSLGATLFELLTGTVPFGPDGGLLQKKGAETPEIPSAISQELYTLICHCLELTPGNRPGPEQLVEAARKFERFGNWSLDEDKIKEEPKKKTTIARETEVLPVKVDRDISGDEMKNQEQDGISTIRSGKRKLAWWIMAVAIAAVILGVSILFFLRKAPGIYLKEDTPAGTKLSGNLVNLVPLGNNGQRIEAPYTLDDISEKCLSCDTFNKDFKKGKQLKWKDIGPCAGFYLTKDCLPGCPVTDSIVRLIKPAKGSKFDDRPTDYQSQIKFMGFRLSCSCGQTIFLKGTLLKWKILERQSGLFLTRSVSAGAPFSRDLIQEVFAHNSCDSDLIRKSRNIYPFRFMEIQGTRIGRPGASTIYQEGFQIRWKDVFVK